MLNACLLAGDLLALLEARVNPLLDFRLQTLVKVLEHGRSARQHNVLCGSCQQR